MVKKSFMMALALLILQVAEAQVLDNKLASLVSIVKSLRQSDTAKQKQEYNKAIRTLAADKAWTPMNELPTSSGECLTSNRTLQRFRLNAALSSAERRRQGVTTSSGQMMNGEDDNFNYSLFEKSVQKGKTVSYTLKGRQGQQTFVVVPYDEQACKGLQVTLKQGGKSIGTTTTAQADGMIVVQTNQGVKIQKSSELTLTIDNKNGQADVAMVILNHNSRR